MLRKIFGLKRDEVTGEWRGLCNEGLKICTHILPWCNSPYWARASSLSRRHDHTQTHHTWRDSFGRVITPTQRPLPDKKTALTRERDRGIHAPGGIRTRNFSKIAAADPHLIPCGQRDRLSAVSHQKELGLWNQNE
jgi:hypothetical protein